MSEERLSTDYQMPKETILVCINNKRIDIFEGTTYENQQRENGE